MKILVRFTAILGLGLISCENCQECFLIEENDDLRTKTPIGERCDQQIEELEHHDLVCLSDECYYQCQ